MPAFPKKITVDLKQSRLFVDGVEFPWFITEEGVDVEGLADDSRIPVVSSKHAR